jgi:hypothetical protein
MTLFTVWPCALVPVTVFVRLLPSLLMTTWLTVRVLPLSLEVFS